MSAQLSMKSQEGQWVRLNAWLIVVGFEYIREMSFRTGGLLLPWNSQYPEKGKLHGQRGRMKHRRGEAVSPVKGSPGVLHGLKAKLAMEVETSDGDRITLSGTTCCKFSLPGSFELHWKIWVSSGYEIVKIPSKSVLNYLGS